MTKNKMIGMLIIISIIYTNLAYAYVYQVDSKEVKEFCRERAGIVSEGLPSEITYAAVAVAVIAIIAAAVLTTRKRS